MSRSYLPLLVALSAIWGSSYMFIKVALRDLDFALLYGVVLLGAWAWDEVAGLVLILAGVSLASGLVGRSRRTVALPEPPG